MPRIPKPSVLQVKRGDPGKRNLVHLRSEPRAPSDELTPPEWLGPIAVAEWVRIVQTFGRMESSGQKLLTNLDTMTMAIYCQAIETIATAETALSVEGYVAEMRSGPAASPWVGIRAKSVAEAMKAAQLLGLTPSGRSRISLAPAEGEPDEFFDKHSSGAVSAQVLEMVR